MSKSSTVDLLFLNGWSLEAAFVEPLVQHFAGTSSYRIVDVDERFLKDAWLESLSALVDENTLIIGWSLGGMLAIRLAYFLQGRKQAYRKLVTLMCAPSFVNRKDWRSGMTKEDFAHFKKAAESDLRLVKTFPYLMLAPKKEVDGGSSGTPFIDRAVLAALKKRYRASLQNQETRMGTLSLLEQLDLRVELASLNQQAVLVFGEHDQLVPLASARLTEELSAQHEVRVIDAESHLLSCSIMDLVSVFCELSVGSDGAVVGG